MRGEAAVGKTTLLDDAMMSATDMVQLSCCAIESEVGVAFSGLHQLISPVLAHLDALPDPQADALRGALGLSFASTDGLLVGAAALTLLAGAAERHPLLVVVDDAQWLDNASTAALLYAARRLTTQRVAVLVGVRDPAAIDLGDLPELRLAGLDRDGAAALLAERGWRAPQPVRDAVLRTTGGNPLALIELTAAGPPEQLSEDVAAGLAVPMGQRLSVAFTRDLDELSAETRMLLLVAAADEAGRTDVVLGAGRRLDLPPAALALAERAGLVRVNTATIRFRHPLIRVAVYQKATFVERAAAHRAVAGVLAERGESDGAAWHRAVGAVGPDEELAAALEGSAEAAERRTGSAAAASALRGAARLSRSSRERTRRMVAAAQAAWRSGQVDLARALTDGMAGELPDTRTEAQLAGVRGLIELGSGDPMVALAQLERGAAPVADTMPAEAASLLILACDSAYRAGDQVGAVRVATAISHLEGGESVRLLGQWLAAALQGRLPVQGTEPWRLVEVMSAEFGRRGGLSSIWTMAVSALGPHQRLAREFGVWTCAGQRKAGMFGTLGMSLTWLVEMEFQLGMWPDGAGHAHEALRIARDTGQRSRAADSLAQLARFAAVQGEHPQCRELAAAAVAEALPLGNRAAAANAAWALALAALAAGDASDAGERLAAVTTPGTPYSHYRVARLAAPDLVEAAIRSDRSDLARRVTHSLRRWSQRATLPWAHAHLHLCDALLVDGDPADEHFRAALAVGDGAHRPFDRARTALLWGEWLRRRRRRADARAQLRLAAELFDGLGAQRWAVNARAQLRAVGGVVRPPGQAHATALLTAQELQVARLAAGGLSNKEIGAQLCLSPRTVGYHLYKLFPKLGISARSQLRNMDLDESPTESARA